MLRVNRLVRFVEGIQYGHCGKGHWLKRRTLEPLGGFGRLGNDVCTHETLIDGPGRVLRLGYIHMRRSREREQGKERILDRAMEHGRWPMV